MTRSRNTQRRQGKTKAKATRKAAATPSLLDAIRATRPQTGRRPSWIDKVPPDQRAQLEELKAAFLAGEIGGEWTPRAILFEIVKPAGIDVPVNVDTFRHWLCGYK